MTSSARWWLRILLSALCLLLDPMHGCEGAAMSYRGSQAAALGDPAPGRAPGPPPPVGLTSDAAKHGLVDEHQQLTIVMTADTGDTSAPCDLDGDLIVVDADKAAVTVNVTHALFRSNVLTHDVVYQVNVQKRAGDNNLVQGFSLHSLGDGEPRGVFTRNAGVANCMKSSIKGQLDESSSHVVYNWTLPLEQPTRSNITFRLRYKIHASSSVFQVNYAFAISQGCQIWLRRDAANISSIDFPRTLECQVYFPGHRNGDGLVLELTRLNVPCSGGGYLQFSGSGNHSARPHRQAMLCGKLEELADNDRQLYFPDLRNHAPYLHLYGHPVFSLNYHLVDHCYNVTFATRNGSFELRPTGDLQCTFKIYLPYGNRVVLKLEIGDESATPSTPTYTTSPSVAVTEEPAVACLEDGLFTELWDGSTSWTHCARRGDLYRRTEIVSRDNRVLMKVSARGYGRQPYALVLRFQYYAEPVPSVVQQCSFGWVAVRQFCVTAVENVRLPWLQAELECNRRGGHLASIRTEQAQSIVDQLLMNSAGYRDQNAYWLGASDKTYEGDFRWTDGLPFSYTNWFPGWSQYDHYNRQPNDDGLSDQDCIEMRRLYHLPTSSVRLSSSFMWNDRDCTTANYFLCERLVADEPMEDGWPPECNRTVTLSREQQRASVSSPAFPRQYPDNADCETEISAPPGYRIVMDFEELVLEREPLCSYDYLEIIEMAGHSANVSRRLCGDWSAKLKLLRYVSTGSRLRLRFVSDYSHHYGGFKARMSMENAMQCADDRLVMFNSSCYLFVSYPEVTWSTAQQICKGMRAQLASVQSPEEERFVTSNIRRTAEYRTSAVYWLGSRMSPEYGTYQWLDGATMSYTAWLPGQNPTEQNHPQQQRELPVTPMCLGIQWTSSPTPMLPSGLYWRSKRCSAVGGYVCKRRNQISGSELNFNRTVNGTEGRLTSPNYPGNYYSSLDFVVKIVGPDRTRLIIQFSKLDLEPQLECLYDYIELRSVIRGNRDALNDAVKWCGNHDTDMERFDFVSETNEAELRFHSDYSISGSGFSVTWHAVDVSACPLQTLTAREGVVTSPNYPHFLLARLDCAITILAPAGKRIWLEITDYDMDGSGWYELGQTRPPDGDRSSEALLELDLGGSSTVFRPFQVSGQLTDGAFVSTGERLQVRLRTADRPLGAGFRAQYKTVNGIQEERIIDLVNVSSGSLLHLNYPNPPPTHIDFLQHLVAPLGHIILLELYDVKFSEHACRRNEASIEVVDNYADSNGTSWHLCYSGAGDDSLGADGNVLVASTAPLAITSYLNTLHIRQRSRSVGIPLNGSVRVRPDVNYKIKLLRQQESVVESCSPNPCQNTGKCMTNGGRKFCQCVGHFTGLFCALTMCELEPCVFGQCTLTASSFRCHCQTGYAGSTCEQKQRPCEGNPCEGRGECIERADTFHCRCHAWWEGARCERRMMHIPYTPLSERMLREPFWLGLITVTIVLAVIGLVWCARRHFPEKLEKLLAEESDRSRCTGTSLRGSSVREQLSGGAAATAAVMVVPSPQPGCQRSLFGRLGIRKPSILSLTSPHGLNVNSHATAAAAARTFSLDDLLKPPPRRTPSPRKKRNNSTPTKKNAAEKKQILQQLISPSNQQRARKVSIGELIQLSERKLKEQGEVANDIKETHLGENNITSTAQITLTDPKLEKKVTFARLLNKVSHEMSSGSDMELAVLHSTNHYQPQQHSGGRASTSTAATLRPASTPPSPAAEMRSPNSTSSNQGSDSLSSSDLALATPSDLFGRKAAAGRFQVGRNKPASADSILAMFRNFSSTSVPVSMAASIRVSPSTTPTASTPQDDVAGDDESTTSSIHTPVSLESPPTHRRHPLQSHNNHSTIEVPVLDALSAHKCNDGGSNFLHPPTILLEVPTSSINKCLSPIREMPTPLPTPLPSPCLTPVLQRSAASSSAEDLGMDLSDDRISVELPCMSTGYSDDDDDDDNNNNNEDEDEELVHSVQDIAIDIQAEDGLIQEEAVVMQQACSHAAFKYKTRPPLLGQTAAVDSTSSSSSSAVAGEHLAGDEDDTETSCLPPQPLQQPVPLVIPMLTIQQPSPTHARPHLLTLPGSPPPHRAAVGIQECSNFHHHHASAMYGDKGSRRMLKDFDKPTSLDLPCAPPLITVTCNMSEAESDAESLSPLATKACNPHLGSTSGTVGMCYLSPFSMCSRADRTASESNLSSSGYSSMASPGPSRCGSNNPLCPSEMEDPGPPGPNSTAAATGILHSQLPRRPSPLLKSNAGSAGGNTVEDNSGEQRGGHCRGRSDSETLSDDPMLESNDEGIGTDHIDEKIEEGELKSAKELEMYIGKDVTVLEDPLGALHMDRLLFPSAAGVAATASSPVCKVSLLQLPSIVIEADPSDSGSMSVGSTLVGGLQQQQLQQQQHVSPVSSRSESPLSDRTVGVGGGGGACGGLGRFSPHFYNKNKDFLPFTDSDGLYDFPSSDCTPQNKVSVGSTMQQHRKSMGRKREKKSARNALKNQSPTKTLAAPTGAGSLHHHQHHHHHHLDVPSGKESYYRVQTPRKPSPKRRARKEQILSSSSSSESLSSLREPKLSSSSPSPDTIRWPAPSPIAPPLQHAVLSSGNSTSTSTVPAANAKWCDASGASRRPTGLVHESSCEEDSADESFCALSPSVADDVTNKQTRKISRLRTISHQIRFLRRLEKSLKRREHLTCPSDSVDSGDGEEYCRVTSPLLQSELGPKPEIRKSMSIGLLHSAGSASNTSTRFKRGKMKKGSDLLIPQEDITWTHVLTTGNGHSD